MLSDPRIKIMFLISVWGVASSVAPSIAATRTPHVASSKSPAPASPSPEPAATSRRSVGGCDPRLVSPLRHHLDLSASEQRVIQSHRSLDRILVCEFYVGEPFGMPVILVA